MIFVKLLLERNDSWHYPLVPHLIDLALEIIDVVVGEVGEAALLEQVVANREPLHAAVGDVAGLADELHDAVLDLVQRPGSRQDGQFAELVGEHRVVVPTLGARIEGVDEGRAADGEALTHRVHRVDRIRHADGRHVFAGGVTGRHHRREILLPAVMHDPLGLPGRAEGGVRAVGSRSRELDVGVGVRLVVVHEDEAVVVGMRERRGDAADAHVRPAAVAAEGDHVDGLVLELALAHERLQRRRRAQRRRARRAELGVHPGHHPGRAVVRRVGDVHAARAPEDDGARPRRFHHQLHHQRRLAALTGAVARGEVLLEGQLLHALEHVEFVRCLVVRQFRQFPVRRGHGLSLRRYSRSPIHCVAGCGFPLAAWETISLIFLTSGRVTSRPPRPQMNPTTCGRLPDWYSAVRTSVATTPEWYGEPSEKSRSMTPTAVKRPSYFARSSAGKCRNQRSRTNPTFLPSARICRMATRTGLDSVPMPTSTTSASSVMYSSKNGLPYLRPNTRSKSA